MLKCDKAANTNSSKKKAYEKHNFKFAPRWNFQIRSEKTLNECIQNSRSKFQQIYYAISELIDDLCWLLLYSCKLKNINI